MNKSFTLILFSVLFSLISLAQGSESFTNMPANSSSYLLRNWTGDNGINWTATDARTDQTLNGRAITIRVGSLTSSSISNGIGSLSFQYKYIFTGTTALLTIKINGTVVGTVSVPSTQTTATTASFNAVNVSGNAIIEVQQSVSGQRVIIDDVTWTAYSPTACSEPSAQPIGPILFTATPTSISGSFSSAIPAPDQYLIIRSTSYPLSSSPQDGTNYANGATIGGGVVVTTTDLTTFTDNGLIPNTAAYYYFIYSVNNDNCGSNYLTTGPLEGNQSTPSIPVCSTPSASNAPLTLLATNTSVSGSFTAVLGVNKYLVIRSSSSTLSPLPVNGNVYSSGQSLGGGTIVSFGTANSFVSTGLLAGTPYYFFVFSANTECTGEPYYSSNSLDGTITTTNGTGIPSGYYDAAIGLSCQNLKTQLQNIISTGYTQLTYTPGVWNAYQFTDIHRNDANTANIIWDIYSDNPSGDEPYTYTYGPSTSGGNQCGNYTNEGDCYNREHSTPKSWFADAYPMYSDVQHLYPTDGKVNALRSNYPYGEVTTILPVSGYSNPSQNGSKLGIGSNFGYSGTVFEPIDEYKGDVARTSLYMATRYENEIIGNNWSGNLSAGELFLSPTDEIDVAKRRLQIYDNWYLQTIFKWINQDPVSQKEIDRNNAIYYQSGQNNRNPYIDHPEYAALVWQCTGVVPVTITDFIATKQKETILLKWFATYETNFKLYELERSTDGINFSKIGEIEGKNLANYSFIDHNLPANSIVYYRLKMMDKDASFHFSKIIAIRLNNHFSNAEVYPNPANGNIKIKLLNAISNNTNLQVSDISGRVVIVQKLYSGQLNIDMDVRHLPSGRYFIQVYDQKSVIHQSFVIIK